MSKNLQQLNISYIAKEDRLLFKVRVGENTEHRIWFTRRYTELLIKALTEQMEKFGGIDSIAVSSDTQESIKQGAFKKEYEKPDEPDFPLGEEGILAFQLKITKSKEDILHLQFLPEKGKGLNFNLDKKMLFMLHNLLLSGISRAKWNLSIEAPPSNELH